MTRLGMLPLVGLLGTGSILAENDVPTAQDYLGRWNMKILNSGDTFYSAWLKIEKVDEGLRGAMVWKWGGVTRVRDVAVAAGELRFRRGKEQFRAKLIDDEILGVAVMSKGRRFYFVGRRAPELCDISGTWKVFTAKDPPGEPGKFMLQEEDGKITGKAVDPDGISYSVRDATLDLSSPATQGYVLRFKTVPENFENATAEVHVSIRGDDLEGTVAMTPRGGAEKKTVRIQGKRERIWGEPVQLLKKDGLDGWVRRGELRRRFNWQVEDGILRNAPPDDDIKSLREFRDHRLHLEYKVEKGANSGIYLRGYYELQIHGSKDVHRSGNMAVYHRLSPKKNPIKEPLEESWQVIDVTLIGRWLTVRLNGETIYENEYLEGITGGAVDWLEGEPGPVLLQGDHGKIQFRNIAVTPAR